MNQKAKNALIIVGVFTAVIGLLGGLIAMVRGLDHSSSGGSVASSFGVKLSLGQTEFTQESPLDDVIVPVSIETSGYASGSSLTYTFAEKRGDDVVEYSMAKDGQGYAAEDPLPGPGQYDLHIGTVGYDRDCEFTLTITHENGGKSAFDSETIVVHAPKLVLPFAGDYPTDGSIKLCDRSGSTSQAALRTVGGLTLGLYVVADELYPTRDIVLTLEAEVEGGYCMMWTRDFGYSQTELTVISGTYVEFTFVEVEQGWCQRFWANLRYADDDEHDWTYCVRQYGEKDSNQSRNIPTDVVYDEEKGCGHFTFQLWLNTAYEDASSFISATLFNADSDQYGAFYIGIAQGSRGSRTSDAFPIAQLTHLFICMDIYVEFGPIDPGASYQVKLSTYRSFTINYSRPAAAESSV